MPRPLEREKPMERVNIMLYRDDMEKAQSLAVKAGVSPRIAGNTSAFIRWLIDEYTENESEQSVTGKFFANVFVEKLDEKLTEFGNKHGFPVYFVTALCEMGTEKDIVKSNFETKFFTKEQMYDAANFALKVNGKLGVFHPNGATK